jgi:hypothetical protein
VARGAQLQERSKTVSKQRSKGIEGCVAGRTSRLRLRAALARTRSARSASSARAAVRLLARMGAGCAPAAPAAAAAAAAARRTPCAPHPTRYTSAEL